MSTDTPERKRGPGRPKSGDKSQVVMRLVSATESLLREVSHTDLSERRIAAAAETNEAMIHYYFGGKDGLLFEVMLRYYDEVLERLKALDAIDPASPSVTRDIFKIMTDAYYEKHWIAKMVVAEFARGSSTFRSLYMEKFGPEGVGLVRLHRILDKLMACGVYDHHANSKYIGLSMFSMITGPFLMAPFSGSAGLAPDFELDEWVDYVADLFDRQLRVVKPG